MDGKVNITDEYTASAKCSSRFKGGILNKIVCQILFVQACQCDASHLHSKKIWPSMINYHHAALTNMGRGNTACKGGHLLSDPPTKACSYTRKARAKLPFTFLLLQILLVTLPSQLQIYKQNNTFHTMQWG